MISVERHEGRLIEIRCRSPITTEEVDVAEIALAQAITAAKGPIVIAVDMRWLRVISDEHTQRLVTVMRRDNPRLVRSCYLVSAASAVAVLQIERMLKEAENPMRRAFRELREIDAWMRDVLTNAERKRLAGFFAEAAHA